MVQYYTLEQAAQILRTTPDELKELARKNVVRAFQDRGSLRFRAQEIEELARSRGYGSDPGLPLADAPPKSSGRRTTTAGAEEVPLGKDPASSKTGASGSRSPSRLGKSPPPPVSGDSDVRLVLDGSDLDFSIDLDSAGQLVKDQPPAGSRPSQLKSGPADSPKPGRKSSRLGPSERVDSGVRMVPMEPGSDSDVRLGETASGGKKSKTGSDSDIRLQELARKSGAAKQDHVTEEIDLDAEAQQAQQAQPPKRTTGTHGAGPVLPTSSPFELSQLDLDVDAPPAAAGGMSTSTPTSDFDLSPHRSDDSLELELGSDEIDVGSVAGGGTGNSGVNLRPADSGLSLEGDDNDALDFAPSLDAGSTPQPEDLDDSSSDFELSLDEGSADLSSSDDDSSSDFELSLDGAGSSPTDEGSSEFELTLQDDLAPAPESSSEFELTLDSEGSSSELALDEGSSDLNLEESPQADSDSEFELTLDESGSLEPVAEGGAEEGDIFETDFDVPSLDEESGSEAVALDEADTDLESSEFDLTTDEESGSQVVPLEEEEDVDEGAATAQRPAADLEDDEAGFEELDGDLDQEPAEDEEVEEEAVAAPAGAAAPAAAPWGVFPALVLMPTFVILFVVALLSFELFQGMWGFHRGSKVSNLIIDPIARQLPEPIGSSSLPAD